MKRTRPFTWKRPQLLAVLLAAGLAAIAPAVAQAAFPGKPGPIVYARFQSGPTWSVPGIFSHGPRLTQQPRRLVAVRSSDTITTSADGRLIAFSSFGGDPLDPTASHLFVMNADGSDLRQLTGGRFYDSHPSFSPDGRRIVFQRAVETNPEFDLYSVGVDGYGLLQLTAGPAGDFEPTFTPGGGRIVFVSDRDSDGARNRSAIYSMRADGSGVRALVDTPGGDIAPDVSPNGRRIVFAGAAGAIDGIFVARADGRYPHPLFRLGNGCARGYCLSDPVWSPDEKHIAALHASGNAGELFSAVVVMRSDGRVGRKTFAAGSLVEVTGSRVGPPSWGPAPK